MDSNNDGYFDIERINYNASLENIIINLYAGDDQVIVDDSSAYFRIDGGEGADYFQIGQIFNSPREANANLAPEDWVTTEETTRGFLTNGKRYAQIFEVLE